VHAVAATSVKIIKDTIFRRFGVPRYLTNDGGTHLMENTFSNILVK
jgi:hypothetical protein